MYPEFSVPGVRPEDTWQLFNVSNYTYYRQKVADLQAGICPFCTIDPAVNQVLYGNRSWRLWKNEMAPRSGQECQLIIPSRRHIDSISDLTFDEWKDLRDMLVWSQSNLGVGANGVLLVRTGDPARNAKSVSHLHFNFQYPTGKDRVEVTIAKSSGDLANKLPVLIIWEKLRVAMERGESNPQVVLSPEEWQLIAGKMNPPAPK